MQTELVKHEICKENDREHDCYSVKFERGVKMFGSIMKVNSQSTCQTVTGESAEMQWPTCMGCVNELI